MEIGRVYLLNPATAVGDKFNPARKVYETRVRVGVGVCVCVCSVVQSTNSLRPHGPAGLLCPWDFPGKNTGVGFHFLLQGSSQPREQTHIFLHW